MLFGFTLAVIVGFLPTAGSNGSNLPTPTRWKLAALAALWFIAHILVLTPYTFAAAIANIAFPVAAAVAQAIPLFRSQKYAQLLLRTQDCPSHPTATVEVVSAR